MLTAFSHGTNLGVVLFLRGVNTVTTITKTSSYVSFTDIERLIGDVVRNLTTRKPENTVIDSTIQSDLKLRAFQVTSGAGDNLAIPGKRRDDYCAHLLQRFAAPGNQGHGVHLYLDDRGWHMRDEGDPGDVHLSCEDFSDSNVNFCKRKNRGNDLAEQHLVRTRSRGSSLTHATVKIDPLFDGDFSLSFSKLQPKFYTPQVLSGTSTAFSTTSTRPQPRRRY